MPQERCLYRRKIDDEIPEKDWCDARRAYVLEGKTLKQIADEHHMDVRSVKRLIMENRSYDDLGKWRKPSVISSYTERIEYLLKHVPQANLSYVTSLSAHIYEVLVAEGYTGSERSVRNYLNTLPWREWADDAGHPPGTTA